VELTEIVIELLELSADDVVLEVMEPELKEEEFEEDCVGPYRYKLSRFPAPQLSEYFPGQGKLHSEILVGTLPSLIVLQPSTVILINSQHH